MPAIIARKAFGWRRHWSPAIALSKTSFAHVALSRSKNCNASRQSRQLGATLELADLQQALEFLDGLLLGDSVHQRDFPAKTVER